jgi:hypothetical protein
MNGWQAVGAIALIAAVQSALFFGPEDGSRWLRGAFIFGLFGLLYSMRAWALV